MAASRTSVSAFVEAVVVVVQWVVTFQEPVAGGGAGLPSALGPVEEKGLVRVAIARAFGPVAGVGVGLSAATVGTMGRGGVSGLVSSSSRAGGGLGGSGGCCDSVFVVIFGCVRSLRGSTCCLL